MDADVFQWNEAWLRSWRARREEAARWAAHDLDLARRGIGLRDDAAAVYFWLGIDAVEEI